MQRAPAATRAKWQRENAKFIRNRLTPNEVVHEGRVYYSYLNLRNYAARMTNSLDSPYPLVNSQSQASCRPLENLTSSPGDSSHQQPSTILADPQRAGIYMPQDIVLPAALLETSAARLPSFGGTKNQPPISNDFPQPIQRRSQAHDAEQHENRVAIPPSDPVHYFNYGIPFISQAEPNNPQLRLSKDFTSSQREESNLPVEYANPPKRKRISQAQPANERLVNAKESTSAPSNVETSLPQRSPYQPGYSHEEPPFGSSFFETNQLRRKSRRVQTDLRQTFHQNDRANTPTRLQYYEFRYCKIIGADESIVHDDESIMVDPKRVSFDRRAELSSVPPCSPPPRHHQQSLKIVPDPPAANETEESLHRIHAERVSPDYSFDPEFGSAICANELGDEAEVQKDEDAAIKEEDTAPEEEDVAAEGVDAAPSEEDTAIEEEGAAAEGVDAAPEEEDTAIKDDAATEEEKRIAREEVLMLLEKWTTLKSTTLSDLGL